MSGKRLPLSGLAALLAAAVLALGGCANLKPVASYGSKGAELLGQNELFIKEFHTSVVKQGAYKRRVEILTKLMAGIDILAKPTTAQEQDQKPKDPNDDANKREKLVLGILELNGVLLKYYQGMAKLAAGDAAPSADSVTGMADKTLELAGDKMESEDKKALAKLAALVVRGLTTEYRRDRLAHLTAEAQPEVDRLLKKEAELLQKQYVEDRENQARRMHTYVAALVNVADPKPSDQTIGFRNLAQAIYWDKLLSEYEEMEKRRAQAELLAQALVQLAACHQALVAFVQDTHSPNLEKALSDCEACVQNKSDGKDCKQKGVSND